MAETDYNEWLNSIEFIDEKGKVLPPKLTKDQSDDPDDDREQEEEK